MAGLLALTTGGGVTIGRLDDLLQHRAMQHRAMQHRARLFTEHLP